MCLALVIDDDDLVRTGLCLLFETEGYGVVSAGSTEEAKATVAQSTPDIIISDYRLTGDDTGLKAISAVRHAVGQELPALVITGDTAPEQLSLISRFGLQVLHKPVDPRNLLSTVRALTKPLRPPR